MLTGYGYKYFPYAPKGKVGVMPFRGARKKEYVSVKVKHIESMRYADFRYQRIKPVGSTKEYLAREAVAGKVTLYVYTEQKSVPLPIPVAGHILSTSIPYDNSLLFLQRDNKIVKINRGEYTQMMASYFGDQPAVAEKIRNKTYRYRDTEALVREYNASNTGNPGN